MKMSDVLILSSLTDIWLEHRPRHNSLSELHFPLNLLRHNSHVWHQISQRPSGHKAHCNSHTVLLSQMISLTSHPPPLFHLSTALTGSSMTLHNTIRLLLAFARAKQTGMWMLLHALTNLPLLSGFWRTWFPSTFFLSKFILSDIFES